MLFCISAACFCIIQKSWYMTEEEYYLLLFSVAVCSLRFISFSLEQCWSSCNALVQLFWLLAYTFYHPFFYNGPIMTYKAFTEQVRVYTKSQMLVYYNYGRIIYSLCNNSFNAFFPKLNFSKISLVLFQMQRSTEENNRTTFAFSHLLLRSGRILLWWCLAECLIHFMYMHSIQSNETYIEILPPWALGNSFSFFGFGVEGDLI